MRYEGELRRPSLHFGNVVFHRSKRTASRLAVLIALAALALPTAAAPGSPPPTKGARWTWPKGALVVVRVSDDFSAFDGAGQAIASAFAKWERAGAPAGNNSGVTFAVGGDVPARYTFHVAYGRVRTGGQARTMMLSAPGGVFVAWTVVDRRVTDPVALSHVMAHEIGHTFGLAECDACEPGSSVMTRFNGDYDDVVSGRNGPSEADNAAVRANGGY
jgi:hypothetical protein